MACYAALISLKQTIERLLNSSRISILPLSEKTIDFARQEVDFLLEHVETIENTGNSDWIGQIREAVWKLEDAFESHVSKQFLLQSENLGDVGSSPVVSLDLEELDEEVSSLCQTVQKVLNETSSSDQSSNPLLEEEDVASSRNGFRGKGSKMVGLSDEFSKIKDLLTEPWWPELDAVPVVGMAGIGKSSLAMKLFEDPSVLSHFEHRAFVTVGQEYRLEEIMQSILCQLNREIDQMHMAGNEELGEYLFKTLRDNRFLLVLDDVWNESVWDYLKNYLPNDINKSRVLVTSRLEDVARHANGYEFHRMRFLNKEESWDLLREEVFGEGGFCPLQLEKYGKKIAENCEGLPLLIITVAKFLSKGEKTLLYWKKVARKENSVFIDSYDEILKVLYPSYKYLPIHLKSCFLYMGVFPPNCGIHTSKLFRLWWAEGFLKLDSSETLEHIARGCLVKLASNSLVLERQQRSVWTNVSWFSGLGIKTCSLHSVFHHLCIKEAGKQKFFHVINRYGDGFTEGIKSQRRLSIRKNVLFGIKDVYESMASIATTRSLLCTGPYHQYPVRICSDLRLLRVLDALTIRFYKFPIEVLELVGLRYLALTCNGEVPPSVSKLWNLEYLIVNRHMSIKKSYEDWSDLPIEIWNMQELRHLQVMGSNLPCHYGSFLPNLLTLSDTSVNSCSKEILEKIPNLEKLAIRIELAPNAAEPLCCFDHLSLLKGLKSFKCVIVNPRPMSRVVSSITAFPSGLGKLSLSGFGYPWEYMRMIAKLPNLRVLKLRCFAFQGPEWVTYEGEFKRLEFLLLKDTDLMHCRGDGYCFPKLMHIIIKHCYKLKTIALRNAPMKIELIDCPSAEASVKQIQEECPNIKVLVHSSWNEEKLKS